MEFNFDSLLKKELKSILSETNNSFNSQAKLTKSQLLALVNSAAEKSCTAPLIKGWLKKNGYGVSLDRNSKLKVNSKSSKVSSKRKNKEEHPENQILNLFEFVPKPVARAKNHSKASVSRFSKSKGNSSKSKNGSKSLNSQSRNRSKSSNKEETLLTSPDDKRTAFSYEIPQHRLPSTDSVCRAINFSVSSDLKPVSTKLLENEIVTYRTSYGALMILSSVGLVGGILLRPFIEPKISSLVILSLPQLKELFEQITKQSKVLIQALYKGYDLISETPLFFFLLVCLLIALFCAYSSLRSYLARRKQINDIVKDIKERLEEEEKLSEDLIVTQYSNLILISSQAFQAYYLPYVTQMLSQDKKFNSTCNSDQPNQKIWELRSEN